MPVAPPVTLVITTYNAGAYLAEAIESVYAQSCQTWRLLIVDDASTDGSLDAVSGLLRDPRVRVIRNETNRGQIRSLNRALELVDTEYFFKLDADDWLCETAVEQLLAIASKSSEDTGFFLTSAMICDEETGVQRPMRQAKWGKQYANRYQLLLANLFPFQVFYRTSALVSVSGWPTEPEHHVEDLAIFLKLIENHRFVWLDELVYFYRKHDANMTGDREKTAAGVEVLIRDALRRWGGRYEPIFTDTPDGWRILGGLIPN